LRHISKNGRKKEEGRRKKEEGRGEREEERREKGEGRREKGEGRREKGEVWEKEGGAASAPPGGRSVANVRLFFRHLGVDHGHGGHVDDI
jgi:hypothetical protein